MGGGGLRPVAADGAGNEWTQWVDTFYTQRNLFLILIKLNQVRIVIPLFRLICHQVEFRLLQNRLKKYDHNRNLV